MCRLPPPHAGIIAPPALSLIKAKPPSAVPLRGSLDRQGLRCSAERMGPGHTVSRGRTPVSMAAHTTFHHCMSPRVRRRDQGAGWPGSPSASSLFAQASKAPKRGYKARGREFAVRTMGGRARKGTGVWRLPDPAPTCDLEKLAAAHLAVRPRASEHGCGRIPWSRAPPAWLRHLEILEAPPCVPAPAEAAA